MEDSGPYEIAEPRVITALETYTPSCKNSPITAAPWHQLMLTSNLGLQTPRLKRLAEIVSAQAMAQQEKADMFDGGVSDVEAIWANTALFFPWCPWSTMLPLSMSLIFERYHIAVRENKLQQQFM
jgi:hypothetical protein